MKRSGLGTRDPAGVGERLRPPVCGGLLLTSVCLAIGVATAGEHVQAAPGDTIVKIWYEGRTCALTLSYDDNRKDHIQVAGPAMNARGLKATFNVLPGLWATNSFFETGYTALAQDGHELSSHTLYHRYCVIKSPTQDPGNLYFHSIDDLIQDCISAKNILDPLQLGSRSTQSFTYPAGQSEAQTRAVIASWFLSARSDTRAAANPPNPPDMYLLNCCPIGLAYEQVWGEYDYAIGQLQQYVNLAKSSGGWVIEMFHDIRYPGYDALSIQAYYDHLDALVADVAAGTLWIAPQGDVARYIYARRAATVSQVSAGPDAITLTVDDGLPDSLYDVPLTLQTEIPAEWSSGVSVIHNDVPVVHSVLTLDGSTRVQYSVVADGTPISISPGDTQPPPDPGTGSIPPDNQGGFGPATYTPGVFGGQGGSTTPYTMRISVNAWNQQGNSSSYAPSMSSDGRFVAFDSYASNLVSGDTDNCFDVFVYDRQTRRPTRVSVDSDGAQANNSSLFPSISQDGQYVAFQSYASNLVPNDTNGKEDVFVHDSLTGTTTRVSVDSAGTQANDRSFGAAVSADGRYVAFVSAASNLVANDANGVLDVFVHDCQTGATTRVSVDSAGNQADGNCLSPAISANGRYVAFYGMADNLVADDTNSTDDVFLHDRDPDGNGVFDEGNGVTTRVSLTAAGGQGYGDSQAPSISGDARYVAFHSAAALVSDDTNGKKDVYLYDRQWATTTRLSVSASGQQGNKNSCSPSISADGRYVAFNSESTNLVSGDTNGYADIFVLDRNTGAIARANTGQPDVQGSAHTFNCAISADGRRQAIESLGRYVYSDTNGSVDIYVRDNGLEPLPAIITDKDNVTVPEGDTASFQVKLAVAPTSDVTVSVSRAFGDADITVTSSPTLTFTPANWDTFQNVSLAAAEDPDTWSGAAVIRCSAAGWAYKDVTASEQDKDLMTILANVSSVSIPEGGTAKFQIKLSAQPLENVEVAIVQVAGPDTIRCLDGPFTFTLNNWDVYQTVVLSAAFDGNTVDDEATFECYSDGLVVATVQAIEVSGGPYGDFDHDSDVDLNDFAIFSGCFNGPNQPPVGGGCDTVDSDGDGDVDLTDFVVFRNCFNGPNRPPACP